VLGCACTVTSCTEDACILGVATGCGFAVVPQPPGIGAVCVIPMFQPFDMQSGCVTPVLELAGMQSGCVTPIIAACHAE
jgi:hypothetical protein